jgi:two-component system chemotaxis response regulator CheY
VNHRVLIVDDSPVMRKIVARSIAMSGLPVSEVLQAGNGKDALALLLEQQVDLVFADLNMPEMSGLEMVEKMAGNPALSKVRVVMISTERNEGRVNRLRELGVMAYLTKPFRPEQLLAAVAPLLETGSAP